MCAANRLPQEEESLSVVELVQLAALVLDLRAQTCGPDKVRAVVTIPSNQPQAIDPALGRFGFRDREYRVRFDLHARSSPLRLERRPGD
jgi:SpoVK/Ycf46/Vps4 family AAA+-type ATPase